MKITTAFFSATNTTKTIVTAIAKVLGDDLVHYNLTNKKLDEEVLISSNEVLLVGMPVYAGRIPNLVIKSLMNFRGNHTPVILVAVYGNREFDDALVEMQDIFETNGFFVMAGATFIAQHSIFPNTAKGRPDTMDYLLISKFAERCKLMLKTGLPQKAQSVKLPGNRPYKVPGRIPLQIVTSSKCNECGACINACPVGAISLNNPHITDNDKCIHCARCINVCQNRARHFSGLIYKVASLKFRWKNRVRKEPQFFF